MSRFIIFVDNNQSIYSFFLLVFNPLIGQPCLGAREGFLILMMSGA